MKLPEDKKERTKVLALIGIGVIFVVGLIFKAPVVGVLPLMKSKKDKLAKIEQLKKDTEDANKEIRQHDKDKAENLEVLKKIVNESTKHVLKPVLGNYKISASEVIEPIAKKYNLKIQQIKQIGVTAEASQTSLRAFSARVSLFCGYDELECLVTDIEMSNPLLSVMNISITTQGSESREKHMVSFDVQWPVWAEVDTPDKLAQQLKDLDKTAEPGAR